MYRYSALLICALMASAAAATAASRYEIVDLGIGEDAYGINDSGQVLVYISNGGATIVEFGIWDKGRVTALPNAFGFGINAQGQATGNYYGQYRGQYLFVQAFVYDHGSLTPLGAPTGAAGSHALAINNRGQIVGEFSDSSGIVRPFLWEKDVFTALPIGLPDHMVDGSHFLPGGGAYAISDNGIIAGYVNADCHTGGSGERQPAMWEHGQLTLIGLPPGYSCLSGIYALGVNNRGEVLLGAWVWRKGVFTKLPSDVRVYAINNSGEVACQRFLPGLPGRTLACVWRDGEVTDLPSLGGSQTFPRAISDSGHLAGMSMDANGVAHAVMWIRR